MAAFTANEIIKIDLSSNPITSSSVVTLTGGPTRLLIVDTEIYFTQYISGKVSKFTDSTLGMIDLKELDITIFPNPTSDFLEIKSSIELNTFSVFNLNGQIVYKDKKITNNKIPLNDLSKGVYLISIDTYGIIKIIKE